MIRYAESFPDALAEELARCPVLYLALGALEWHGEHLPLGLDGIVAEAFVERLAQRLGGVVLPSIWLPITTLPHPFSLDVRPATATAIWTDCVSMASKLGARVLCLVSGHYAQGHMVELQRLARDASSSGGVVVLAATPLEFIEDDALLDHAGRYETSQLMAIRPGLSRLDRVPPHAGPQNGVLGDSPVLASAAEGDELLSSGLDTWEFAVKGFLESNDPSRVLAFYERRLAANQTYIDQWFRGSWEDAIRRWWTDRSQS